MQFRLVLQKDVDSVLRSVYCICTMNEIQKLLVPVTHLGNYPTGYANGYVGVPLGHSWYGVGYDDIDVDIHGGLTYSSHCNPATGEVDNNVWWVGFDVCHNGDTLETCDEAYCVGELNRLYNRAETLYRLEREAFGLEFDN